MFRKLKIQTRLFAAFFIMMIFTLWVGVVGYICLKHRDNSAVQSMNSLLLVNSMYDYTVDTDNGVYYLLTYSNPNIIEHLLKETRKRSDNLQKYMVDYMNSLEPLSGIFTRGEMQTLYNNYEIYTEVYIPLLNAVLDLVAHGDIEQAAYIYEKRLDPIYGTVFRNINNAFDRTLALAKEKAYDNSKQSAADAFQILIIIVAAFVACIILTFIITRTISAPLMQLEAKAELMAKGNLDIKFEQIDGRDEISRLSTSLHDATRQLKQIHQLKIDSMEIRLEKEKAEAASKSKSDFLARMSHEIRTPMNAITGMAELALRENMSPIAKEHIYTIKQAGANLLSIINDILDLSKIESGKLEIIPDNYTLSSLVNDVISIIRMRVMDSGLRFVVNIDSKIPNLLYGDEIRIRQILLNVLSNAVKYTKKGFISFDIKGTTVSADSIVLTVNVNDSGKGIREEDIQKLFGDFVQVDLAENKGIEGTGLGLSITKNLVSAMGGDINVQSVYGKGSTFTVTLPQKIRSHEPFAVVDNAHEKSALVYERREIYIDSIVRTIDNLGVNCENVASDEELRDKLKVRDYSFIFVNPRFFEKVKKAMADFQSKASVALLCSHGSGAEFVEKGVSILSMPVYSISVANILNGASGDFSYDNAERNFVRFNAPGARVLVVDDINTNLRVVAGLLSPYKMHVDMALNGALAVELVNANRYDLVLMDHMMPEMDGVETVRRIRMRGDENPYFKNVPIVALTANAVAGTKEMFLANGFSDYLSKPIDIIKLNAVLEKIIPREKQMSAISHDLQTVENVDIKITGIDVKLGVYRTGGTAAGYLRTLAMFCSDGRQKIDEIKRSLEADNVSLYAIYVHALKSAAANIGAVSLSEAAAVLESAGKRNDREFIDANTADVLEELEALVCAAEAAISEEKEMRNSAIVDTSAVRPILITLNAAISTIDPAAINAAVKELEPFENAAEIGGKIENILRFVLNGEYDIAASTIESLL